MLLQRQDGRLLRYKLFCFYRRDDVPTGWTLSFLAPLEMIDKGEQAYYRGLLAIHWMREDGRLAEQLIIDIRWGKKHRLALFIPAGWPMVWPVKLKKIERHYTEE